MSSSSIASPGAAAAAATPGVIIPVSSPHDPHAYRISTLSNGLTCMLINDKPKNATQREREAAAERKQKKASSSATSEGEESEVAADKPAVVALSVRVGHWSDPAAIPGLAHFLEHMLFMGNKQFPGENEWEEYLSEHGGSSNH